MSVTPKTNLIHGRAACVLVVEDDPNNIVLMRELLGRQGYQVEVAGNVSDAQQMIRRNPPDLVLMDVIMPGRNGFDLCTELKSNPATRLIPIILITGLTAREERMRGIECGADEFLNKPFDPEELFARVRSLLRLKEFTDELDHAEAVLCTLARSVEARDPYTEGHCERLSHYASDLGRHIGLDEESVIALKRGGILHDLGKITIPDHILKKGSNLTEDEWKIMREHPATGETICRPLRTLHSVLPIIRHHHEHWNGSGYPDQLGGAEIPLLARVLQVVDVYDALRTERPYKRALSHEIAEQTMLLETAQGLWDRELVLEFFGMLQGKAKAA